MGQTSCKMFAMLIVFIYISLSAVVPILSQDDREVQNFQICKCYYVEQKIKCEKIHLHSDTCSVVSLVYIFIDTLWICPVDKRIGN